MTVLTVRNNWESLEWRIAGDHIDPRVISEACIGGTLHRARRKERVGTYSDMGNPTTVVRSADIEIEITVMGVTIWVSLYQHPKLRELVSAIREVGSAMWIPHTGAPT